MTESRSYWNITVPKSCLSYSDSMKPRKKSFSYLVINPCYITPCFINPCFITPCFVNPCFVNPVHVLPIQSSPYFITCHRRGRQRERQKTAGVISKTTTSFCTCIALVCTFLCLFFTTTTWKWLILRFTEYVNKQRLNYISLSALGFDPRKSTPGGFASQGLTYLVVACF